VSGLMSHGQAPGPVRGGKLTGEVYAIVAGGNLTLSWPLASAGFTLMSRTNLVLGDWTAVPSQNAQIIGSQWQITIPLSGGARYYRLARS
jgi:hypothetical protein